MSQELYAAVLQRLIDVSITATASGCISLSEQQQPKKQKSHHSLLVAGQQDAQALCDFVAAKLLYLKKSFRASVPDLMGSQVAFLFNARCHCWYMAVSRAFWYSGPTPCRLLGILLSLKYTHVFLSSHHLHFVLGMCIILVWVWLLFFTAAYSTIAAGNLHRVPHAFVVLVVPILVVVTAVIYKRIDATKIKP